MSAAGASPAGHGGPGVDPELFDELFPLDPAPTGRRERSRRRRPAPSEAAPPAGAAPPASTATPESADPAGRARLDRPRPERSTWRRAAAVGLACGLLALAVRLVLVHVLPADVHHLSASELGLGVLAIAVVTGWCARSGVAVVVCVAGVLALSTVDIAAPVGIGLVLVAALVGRHSAPRPT